MAQALDSYGTVRFTATLAICFMSGMANYTKMPNLSLLATLHISEQVPVVLRVGPDHVRVGPDHV